jgi:hypothetical protein
MAFLDALLVAADPTGTAQCGTDGAGGHTLAQSFGAAVTQELQANRD